MENALKKPVPFALGALVAPGVSGFAARALNSPKLLSLNPLLTRGVMLAGTTVGALTVKSPFLWGAFLGQLAPTMDLVAEMLAGMLLAPTEVAMLPSPAAPGVAGLRLASAERYAEGAAAGQITPEDVAEMEALKRDLASGGMGESYEDIYSMKGISDQRRVGFRTGEVAAARRVTRF